MSKKSNQVLRTIQWIVVLFISYGVYNLVMSELSNKFVCPKILDVSACYVLAGCLVSIALSFLSSKLNFLFVLGASIGWSLSAMATYYQFKGALNFPKTVGELPMSYVLLGLFTLLFLLDQFRK